MVVETKLYDILGIKPTATQQEIRSAYKRMAVKHHPDKNIDDPSADDKFKEIQAAYEVLNDPDARKIYDQYGIDGLQQGKGGFDPPKFFDMDIFKKIFNINNMFDINNHQRHNQYKNTSKTKDFNFSLGVTLEDIYNGKESNIKITRNIICIACIGRGVKQDVPEPTCGICKGSGHIIHVQNQGFMTFTQNIPCNSCHGKGRIITPDIECEICHGNRLIKNIEVLKCVITPGSPIGKVYCIFRGKSDEYPGMTPGDVRITLVMKDSPGGQEFTRQGNNLIVNKKISLADALTKFNIHIHHLDGRELIITREPGITRPGDMKVVPGQGMPIYIDPSVSNQSDDNIKKFGNLIIKIDIEFPPDDFPRQKLDMIANILNSE